MRVIKVKDKILFLDNIKYFSIEFGRCLGIEGRGFDRYELIGHCCDGTKILVDWETEKKKEKLEALLNDIMKMILGEESCC